MMRRASALADLRRSSVALVCVVACAMLTIMLDHGIRIGMENHSGMLPVVRRILDPTYLPGDFGIAIREHHHRIFAMLVAALAHLGLGETGALVLLTWAGFALHFAGLWQLGTRLEFSTARRVFICVALATGFAYLDRGAEANRLLGNGPIMPPTFAHAFILFSLSALVGKRWNLAFACAGAVALVHLQIGAAWLLVLALVLVWRGDWREPRAWLPGLVIAALIASPALLDLVALVRVGLVEHIADTRDVAFRMPQHFRVYPGRLAIVLVYLIVMATLWYRWRRRERERAVRFAPLLAAAVVIVALTLVHYLDYYVIGSGWIARMQLLRLSMFVPLLGALAIVAAIPEPSAQRTAPLRYAWWVVALILPIAACVNLLVKHEPPSLRVHDEALADDDWADICRRIRADGPVGLYVTPPGNQGFGAFSHRSTLVEFKINPDGGAGLEEWRTRLLALSGGTFPTVEGRREMAEALNGAYARLPPEHFAPLRERYGVRYAVVPTDSPLRGTTLLANRGYRVVAL